MTLIMYKQVRLNDQNKKLYSSNMKDIYIYTNNIMNQNISRQQLSNMSKEQLIDMLLGQKPKPVISVKLSSLKSLTQLAAEKLEQSIKRPAVVPKTNTTSVPTLKTLAANAMVKDKIKYFENLSDKQTSIIRLDKKPVPLQDMRDEEWEQARVSKYMTDSSFQNLFHDRLQQKPEFKDKTYGPFISPKLKHNKKCTNF